MTALWTLLRPHAFIASAVLLVGVGSFYLGYRTGRPTTPVSIHVIQQQVKLAHDTVRKTDTLVTTKDKLLTKILTRIDTLKTTERITDTMWVKQEVHVCDSLASSCADYRAAAQQKFRADSLLFATQAREVTAWRAQQPSKLHTIATLAIAGLVGVGLCKAGVSIPLH